MAFRVELAPRALRDLDSIVEYLVESGSLASAQRWLDTMMKEIRSLADLSEAAGSEVWILVHGHRNRAYKICVVIDVPRRVVQVLLV